MNNNDSSSYYDQNKKFQEQCSNEYLSLYQFSLHYMEKFSNSQVEIFLGKTLNINNYLEEPPSRKLIMMLQKHPSSYAWEYTHMKGIDPKTCMHHIYIQENVKIVRKTQRRMHRNLMEVVKEELQKLLNLNFIYPISDSQWLSPPMIVPNKN